MSKFGEWLLSNWAVDPYTSYGKDIMRDAYGVICKLYGDDTASSGVPFINHIDDGVVILIARHAEAKTIAAYMLHPLFQSDESLVSSLHLVDRMDHKVMALVMEYRNKANAWLSDNPDAERPTLPLHEVKEMLVADKVQNRKDFMSHHRGTHPNSEQLERYFDAWLEHLGVDKLTCLSLERLIDSTREAFNRQHEEVI